MGAVWRWDAIEPARNVRSIHAEKRVARDGVGLPVVLQLGYSDALGARYFALPQNGISLPATAVLDFGPRRPGRLREVELRLINTRDFETARLQGKTVALATDLSAPIEKQLQDRYFFGLRIAGLFDPGSNLRRAGIFATEPYASEKIPVVFVHGLYSDPHIWQNALNGVLADPELRRNYQLWYFVYPTGLPVQASARRLRAQLVEARRRFDPKGKDPGMNRMVLIGHSMGGLVARMQAINSGDAFWHSIFTKAPAELPVSVPDRQVIVESLYFPRVPWVRRVVFAASPHRGSEIADLGLIQLVVRLIKLPFNIARATQQILALSPEILNPELRKFRGLGIRSVETLSPRHPYFAALAARPIEVPFHSIIGDRGRGDSPGSSDGAVPYRSSHLDGAQSEKIIPGPHSLTARPDTVEEIVRILRLHLRASTPPRRGQKRQFVRASEEQL